MLRKFSGTIAVNQLRSAIVVLVLGAMTSFWIGQVAGHPAEFLQQPASPTSQTQAGSQTRHLPSTVADTNAAQGVLSSSVLQQLIYVQQKQQPQPFHAAAPAKTNHTAKPSDDHHKGKGGKGGDD